MQYLIWGTMAQNIDGHWNYSTFLYSSRKTKEEALKLIEELNREAQEEENTETVKYEYGL